MKSLDELKDWDSYRQDLKVALSKLGEGEQAPFHVSKEKIEFSVKGSVWKGRLVLVGERGDKQARQLTTKEGVKFVEGSCLLAGSTLRVSGIEALYATAAEAVLKKSSLGFGCEFSEDQPAPADAADMSKIEAVLQRLAPAVKAAVQQAPERKAELLAQLLGAQKAIEAGDSEQAQGCVLELSRLLKAGATSAEGTGPDARANSSVKLYRAAMETVDGQISALAGVLRQSGDPELVQIADKGLNAITSGHKVKLQAALMEFQSAQGPTRKAAAGKVAALAGDFASFLDEDPRVEALDTNPGEARVTLRATLGPALARLVTTMESVGA